MCTHTHGTILLRVPLSKEYLLRYGTMVPSVSGSTLMVLNMMGPIEYSNRYKVTHNSRCGRLDEYPPGNVKCNQAINHLTTS